MIMIIGLSINSVGKRDNELQTLHTKNLGYSTKSDEVKLTGMKKKIKDRSGRKENEEGKV